MKQNETKKSQKSQLKNTCLYKCIFCDYITYKNADYSKHLLTRKHLNNTNETNMKQMSPNVANTLNYVCKCTLAFNSRTTLWRHHKTCDHYLHNLNLIQFPLDTISVINTPSNVISTQKSYMDNNVVSMFMEVIKQNSEFKELLVEQNKTNNELTKQVIELSKEKTITNTNCNNTNNKFNLNLFLNETCKDAMNMSDFLNQLQLTTKDLELTGQDGFAVGIGHSFVQGIKALEVNKRPLHCSDLKREIFYIKEDNIWEKEDEKRGKLTKAIQKIAHKNILNIPAWKAEHPYCRDQHHKDNDKFLQIMIESMTGKDDPNIIQEYDKIIRNVAKEVFIDKS